MKSIDSIVWPDSVGESVRSLQIFMLQVVEQLGISFDSPAHDPISTIRGVLAGKLCDDDRSAALRHWWTVVDEKGVRNFEGGDVLIARLAICLLSPGKDEAWGLSEQLSWFLEVLGFLGADVNKAVVAMEKHFEWQPES